VPLSLVNSILEEATYNHLSTITFPNDLTLASNGDNAQEFDVRFYLRYPIQSIEYV
jgi:hypothetical protein